MSVRMATVQDLPRILEIYAPYVENTTVTFEYTVPTGEEFLRRFLSVTGQFPWLVWEEDGHIVGYAYACAPFARAAYSWCAEPSVYLLPEYRGRGIGKRLYAALEQLLRLQGYRLSYAIITSENRDSLAFHEAVGYRRLADFPGCAWKFGKNLGIIWMEKSLNTAEIPSNFPIPFPTFVNSDENLSKILDILSLS